MRMIEHGIYLRTRNFLKRIWPFLIQPLIIISVTLIMGEVALRVYNHYIPSFVFYQGSHDRFRGKPYAEDWNFNLNSKGFKDQEFVLEKKREVYRILGIGDSFSFGIVPYQFNYLTLIESQMFLKNMTVEVYNMGIPCIGPKDYLSLFIDEGLAFKPDMLLLSFFTGNDFDESKKRKIHEYSYVLSLLHYIVNLKPEFEGKTYHKKAEYCDNCPNFTHEKYLQIERGRSDIYLDGSPRFPEYFQRALYYLEQINNICIKRGIKLVIVIIPDELQINRNLRMDVQAKHFPDVDSDRWNFTRPNTMLSQKLNELGIDNVDLFKYFAAESSSQLYRPRDTHWNIAGNQLAADVIGEHLRKYLKK